MSYETLPITVVEGQARPIPGMEIPESFQDFYTDGITTVITLNGHYIPRVVIEKVRDYIRCEEGDPLRMTWDVIVPKAPIDNRKGVIKGGDLFTPTDD